MIIQKQPNPSGAYPAPQTWHGNRPPVGYAIIDLDMTEFYSYNGFVILAIEGDTVTGYTPNTEAWEKWKAEQPEPQEPEPTTEERVSDLERSVGVLEDAICEMDEANEERMAAIEDALCEMDMG
jgi:hypothetical protein